MRLLVVLLAALLVRSSHGLKFLAYNPLFGRSHTTFVGKLAEVLVDAGHEVVMLAPILDNTSPYVGTDKVERVLKVPPCSASMAYSETITDTGRHFWKAQSDYEMHEHFGKIIAAFTDQCNATLNEPGLMELLEKEKFDAAFTEPMDLCGYGIFHRIGVKSYATVFSIGAYEGSFEQTGLPSFPSYVPGTELRASDRMTFFERLNNAMALVLDKIFSPQFRAPQEQLLGSYLGNEFNLVGSMADSSLWFINAEPLIDFPRPIIHKVIDIGGITLTAGHKQLNETWSSILNLRPQTVLISFGTVAQSFAMPDNYKQTIREVISKFPEVTFIWKYEKPEHKISEGIPNLIETTWVPQKDMLYDPRLSLFITHCGMGSTTEATTAGIPLIAIPMIGDQMRNAAVIERIDTGVVLEKDKLENTEALEKALRTVLQDEKYRTKARAVGEMIRNRPFPPRETFVRNMEFLARFGPLRMLDHYGKHLNFLQYYLIDVISFIAFTTLLALYICYKIMKFICSRLFCAQKKQKNE